MAAPDLETRVETTEDDLVRLACTGDEAAFEQLYEAYFPRIYRFVEKRLSNRADTEETVQEVFINVFNSIGSYRAEAPFAAWVFGLTRRTIASRFKKKRHATVPLESEDEFDRPAHSALGYQLEPSPLEIYEYEERLAQLETLAASRLSPEQRMLFELHHLKDQSIGDIAMSLSKSEDAVKSNLYRARKILLAR